MEISGLFLGAIQSGHLYNPDDVVAQMLGKLTWLRHEAIASSSLKREWLLWKDPQTMPELRQSLQEFKKWYNQREHEF